MARRKIPLEVLEAQARIRELKSKISARNTETRNDNRLIKDLEKFKRGNRDLTSAIRRPR